MGEKAELQFFNPVSPRLTEHGKWQEQVWKYCPKFSHGTEGKSIPSQLRVFDATQNSFPAADSTADMLAGLIVIKDKDVDFRGCVVSMGERLKLSTSDFNDISQFDIVNSNFPLSSTHFLLHVFFYPMPATNAFAVVLNCDHKRVLHALRKSSFAF